MIVCDAPCVRMAPATFLGWEYSSWLKAPQSMWALTQALPERPAWAIVSGKYLRDQGFTVIDPPHPGFKGGLYGSA